MVNKSEVEAIEESGFFDKVFYLTMYGIRENSIEHYLLKGAREGFFPNPEFDTAYYRMRNQDVVSAGMNPLLHYIFHGREEGRICNPLQDGFSYRNSEARFPTMTTQWDTEGIGWYHLLRESALFDEHFYRMNYPEVEKFGFDPVAHYLMYGAAEDKNPGPEFDSSFYLEKYPDVLETGMNPLVHYVLHGEVEGRSKKAVSMTESHDIVEDQETPHHTVTAIVGIPRSGLTLTTALTSLLADTTVWFLPYTTRKNFGLSGFSDIETINKSYLEAFPDADVSGKHWIFSESTADEESMGFVFESLGRLQEEGISVRLLWVMRDIDHCYLSQMDAAHRYWGAEQKRIDAESYEAYIDFARRGYRQIVERIVDFDHLCLSYENLLRSPEEVLKKVAEFIGNDIAFSGSIDWQKLKALSTAGDPGFEKFEGVDGSREEMRRKEWKDHQVLRERVNPFLALFARDFNECVSSIDSTHPLSVVDVADRRVEASFDPGYYLERYEDLRKGEMDPWEHYRRHGWQEDRDPTPWFETRWYREHCPYESSMDPFTHYLMVGRYFCEAGKTEEEPKRVMEDLVIIDPENYEITEDLLLEVPKFKQPKVSILIPAYNQQNYTMACIESIIKNTEGVSYEIIVMDDKSPDPEAQAIEAYLKNVKFVVNGVNYGFLRNCNKGAQFAIGEYILFLNNDTNPQPGWLSSLVELIESADDIGMVGSRLVYPTGQQQEAGGIVWQDASAWNFGRLDDPYKPDYNYVKEADYLTGAAMMIRRDLWEEIDGFDERYVPAYYEDTDIAFEVRKRGYRTLYQPRSVVIHFEGISNGTDTGSGIKRYQVINHDKFYEKWKEVLTRDHFPNAQHVFLARDRSRYKKHILFVDHYLPHYDQDAGSKAAYQYLKILAKSGMQVHFIGDNFYDYPGTPYLDALTQLGIEVLYGNWYANHWEEWLEENGAYLDYVILSRPHIAPKYLEAVKRHTQAKIVYIGHDLHFLRERREYEIKGDAKYLESSEKWKEAEMALIRDVDSSWYFSEIEQQIVQKEDPSVSVDVVPLYIYEDFPKRSYRAEERQDIMFIGGFDHAPNVDAVVWFVREIWPLFILSNPGAHFYIIGSKPKPEILALAGDDITVTGFVSDEELEGFYDRCRMMVAPLRYGAGVKGKVIDALYHGMPLVTTSIGAEGIRGAEKIMAIEDDAESFAQTLNHLYNDPKVLERMSAAELYYCREHFSVTAAKRRMGKVIEEFREDS